MHDDGCLVYDAWDPNLARIIVLGEGGWRNDIHAYHSVEGRTE